MKFRLSLIPIFLISFSAFSQTVTMDNTQYQEAYDLAIQTIDINTRRGVLAAGADYGGEWTRDIAINVWNGVGLLRPEVAKKSLWSVCNNKQSIGHQYWDKIIWTIGAYEYYCATGDLDFLKQAYVCASNTMTELENSTYDDKYGLFMGASVFNDGIAAYQPPIFDQSVNSSFVLHHPNHKTIKCLSTNCIYYGAYQSLAEMGAVLGKTTDFTLKAEKLRNAIRNYLYDSENNQFYYLIDNNDKLDKSQEGLGISFALLFGVIEAEQAFDLLANIHVSEYGITSIYPDFVRFSESKPGRHNNIIWPMINGFFADAASKFNDYETFQNEMDGLVQITLDKDKGNYNFREIFNPYTGKPDGGWQVKRDTDGLYHWESCHHQTWSATAYLRMVLNGLAGLNLQNEKLVFEPFLPQTCSFLKIEALHYRNSILLVEIEGTGSQIKTFSIDGQEQAAPEVLSSLTGHHHIQIELK